jgi:hypothetical protein
MKGEFLMFSTIDFKSVLIGGLSAVVILCLIGAVPFVAPEEYGRFQIETNNSYAFVLDSATGQVWSSMFVGPDSGVGITYDEDFHAPKTDKSSGGGSDGGSAPQSR